jgi:hypothetical protein
MRALTACLLTLSWHSATCYHSFALQTSTRTDPAGVVMGRAEKRMAKKRRAKGQQYTGGRPLTLPAKTDILSKSTVLKRLSEVPVFGIRNWGDGAVPTTDGGWVAAEDGVATFYLDSREAEQVSETFPAQKRVVGVGLETIFFDTNTRLKPSSTAVKDLSRIPAERALVREVSCPLYCIDGMQTTDKESGVNSLPLFFERSELLEFATPVYGASEAEQRVLVTDLQVATSNMLQGPAGLLRNAKFFASAKALKAMDDQATAELQETFGTATGQLEQGLFGGMKLPWQ